MLNEWQTTLIFEKTNWRDTWQMLNLVTPYINIILCCDATFENKQEDWNSESSSEFCKSKFNQT